MEGEKEKEEKLNQMFGCVLDFFRGTELFQSDEVSKIFVAFFSYPITPHKDVFKILPRKENHNQPSIQRIG